MIGNKKLAALATTAVLAAMPLSALAQAMDAQAMEARMAQLEQEMQQMRDMLQAYQQRDAANANANANAAVAPPATALDATRVAAPASPAVVMPNAMPGTKFSFGGFIKLDSMYTRTSDGEIADGSAGRLFYFPGATPVAVDGKGRSASYTDVHAQFSRFWLGADTTTERGDKLKAYIEADMYGGGSNAFAGNEVITNTYALTLRQAYVSWNNWLAGQTWSNFQDVAALPDTVDFTGPSEGTIFSRQAQLRYTRGPWSFSAENPQTTITPFGGKGARINSSTDVMPDLTARWLTRGDWGHFTVAALLRNFRYDGHNESGGALSVSGKFNMGANDDLRYMVSGGAGVGRYLGFALGSDTALDEEGRLHAMDGYGGFAAWRHAFSPKLRGNLVYSVAVLDNDTAWTGYEVTDKAQSVRANLIYSPFPKLDLGVELSHAQRRLENGEKGDMNRVHTHVKYNF
ncbi:DcaP family trimeric outer membrane transporter [Stenotrophomonas sp. MH1]|uniref:DcaP family trimeric outer membrane transporter n=1 Tax=Stenotrophomonas capsici TaxID=3110230 RepID=A0ABU5V737_9GAMM|nr:DcaP family trimeric outer membrane transporter [Stenotrophomonas sp. MH1]MEA5668534.1 DcaP family trimeric outer membrane transporter [Stenotrophomonas sp. MH1]